MIRIQDLHKGFGRKQVLSGLSLDVPAGAVYGLVGANGTGKTTTIQILLNILRGDRGEAELLGVPSRGLQPVDFTRIGYVSENQQLPDWMTVGYFFDYLRPFYPAWDAALCAQLTEQMDLPLDRKLRDLSRGMKMKASLVSSLAYRPRVLILDEPFSGLDPLVRDELIEGLLDQAGETTILLSSHDLAEMESFASHVGFLEDGRLRFSEETAALAGRFREVEVTLADPPPLPSPWPESWLAWEAGAAVVRFVDSQYRAGDSEERIRTLFPRSRAFSVQPMTLRQIFVTMARTRRARAA